MSSLVRATHSKLKSSDYELMNLDVAGETVRRLFFKSSATGSLVSAWCDRGNKGQVCVSLGDGLGPMTLFLFKINGKRGGTDIVSALHDIPAGEVWPLDSIRQHQALIEDSDADLSPLKWTVVESIPVHKDVKLARPVLEKYIANWITTMENLAACGIKTICYNFMPAMARQFGPRIHFSHLRGVKRDPDEQRSFYESSHLDSDIDMVQVIKELLDEEKRRKQSKSELTDIFIRPDHGLQMTDDIDNAGNPAYSGIGRLKGVAEMRGVIRALSAQS